MINKNIKLLFLLLGLVLAGCGTAQVENETSEASVAVIATSAATKVVDVQRSTPTATNEPAATPSPVATSTPTYEPTATSTLTPTLTPSPTATPIPPHPLSIEYLRQQVYPGEGLAIERELESGSNYSRYLASYMSEGNKNFALLTVPRGKKPESGWPVIIFNHGYIPPKQYRTTERYVAYVDAFARNGYIVFRPDYRGHGNSEGEPEGAYGHPGYTIDVLNAVAAMKGYPDADPERIGMWGHSMGGYITLRSMLVDDAIKAGVIWSGVVGSYADFFDIWTEPRFRPPPTIPKRILQWRQNLVDEYGTPAENPGFWDQLSANTFVAELSGPLQIHHGTSDTVVPIEFSQILSQQVEDAGGTVEYFEWQGADHNITQSFNSAMQESLRFFDEYLKRGS